MLALRIFLTALWLILTGYTAVVGWNHGFNLLPIFFGDIARLGWPGQFNLDFMFMLFLSALWVSWRHKFSGIGWLFALLALFGGSSFLTIYLLALSVQTKGNVKKILLGGNT